MTDAPEKIFEYSDLPVISEHSTEYIRKDIVMKALEECQEEIDNYVRQEYQLDHPVQERYRQRGFSSNPARIALKELKENN
jgi:hypothetical protein